MGPIELSIGPVEICIGPKDISLEPIEILIRPIGVLMGPIEVSIGQTGISMGPTEISVEPINVSNGDLLWEFLLGCTLRNILPAFFCPAGLDDDSLQWSHVKCNLVQHAHSSLEVPSSNLACSPYPGNVYSCRG